MPYGTLQGTTDSGFESETGVSDDDVWFSFTATSASHKISLQDVNANVWAGYDLTMEGIPAEGDEFTADIMEALRRYHSLLIGERTAEQIKITIGAATKDLEIPPDDMPVNGRDLVTGIPKQIMVSYQEIAEALDKSIFKIEEAILKALETTPPELASDIYRRGLYLTGGGALLKGLDKRLSQKIKLPVHIADDPLKSVVRGTGIALQNYQRYPFVMR